MNIGHIPKNICGTLFRNMPSRFERGDRTYGHYLDGDGYILRFSIANGKASLKSKFVRSEEFSNEERDDKILYRSTFRTQKNSMSYLFCGLLCPNNAFDLKLKNLANTNVKQLCNLIFTSLIYNYSQGCLLVSSTVCLV